MTLSTLQGVKRLSMGDLANAFQLKGMDTLAALPRPWPPAPAARACRPGPPAPPHPAHSPARLPVLQPAPPVPGDTPNKASPRGCGTWPDQPPSVARFTHQFQQIASNAMKNAALPQNDLDATRNLATGIAQEALKTAPSMASQFLPPVVASPAKKPAPKPPPPTTKTRPPAAPLPHAASRQQSRSQKSPGQNQHQHNNNARKKAP